MFGNSACPCYVQISTLQSEAPSAETTGIGSVVLWNFKNTLYASKRTLFDHFSDSNWVPFCANFSLGNSKNSNDPCRESSKPDKPKECCVGGQENSRRRSDAHKSRPGNIKTLISP